MVSAFEWRECIQAQEITYKDEEKLQEITEQLFQAEGIVKVNDIEKLKQELLQDENDIFIIMGGDCAEQIDMKQWREHYGDLISLFNELEQIARKAGMGRVVKIARAAGQYFKPREQLMESVEGEIVPSYRGDGINSKMNRNYDPERLLKCLEHAQKVSKLFPSSFYFCHEALNLYYESSLTRGRRDDIYDLSCHLPWLGYRTTLLEGAHVKYLQGIDNPIGIKVGPNMSADHLRQLLWKLRSRERPILLITRYGLESMHMIQTHMQVVEEGMRVLWICDPMHGNTIKNRGEKVRLMDSIMAEVQFIQGKLIENGLKLHGIHLEMTGNSDILECLDNCSDSLKYSSLCDPRVNREQAIRIMTELFIERE